MSRATPYQLDLGAGFGTWEWDQATDESTWSDELYAILGLSPETALASQSTYTSCVHVDDLSRVAVALDKARREGARAELEHRIVRGSRTGQLRFVRLRAWRSADERHLHVLVEDVTSQSAITERLSSVSAFAAGVAHEINNPLGFLSANVELIDRELGVAKTQDLEELLREARHGIQRIHTVVRGLMTFSRVEPTHHEPLDINRVIEVAVGIAHTHVRQRAKLVRDFRPVPLVDANAARLGQVFVNLLLNAAQAIPAGSHHDHEIAIATSVDAHKRVVVEVRDTGHGIPRSLGARVFEAFVTTKPVGAGPGLGLTVCRNIVNAVGGEISFESEPGKTVFRVILPSTASAPRATVEPSIAPATRRGSVLIVDDEPVFASSLKRLLSREHDVSTARDGNEALERFRAGERFDAIISDLMMPGLGGVELYTQLVALAPEQAERMIFISGNSGAQTAELVARTTNPCFDKPCDLKALRAAVRRLVS